MYHVVGFTQYMGTCKFHLFKDCSQLVKKRVSHMIWGDRDSTGVIHEAEYDDDPRRICKLCLRREKESQIK